MATEWYYMIDNVKSGPVSAQKLKQLAAAKQIDDKYLLLRDGMKTWVKASNVKGLFQMHTDTTQSSPQFQKSPEKQVLLQGEVSPKVNNSKTNKGLSSRKKHPIIIFFGVILLFLFIVNIPLFSSSDGRHYNGLIDLAKEYLSHPKKIDNPTVQEIKKKDDVEESLKRLAKELNSRLPKTLDEDTRLDAIVVGPGKCWVSLFTLLNLSSYEINETNLRQALSTERKENACSSEFKKLLDNGVQLIDRYSGRDGKFIGDIIINPNDCN